MSVADLVGPVWREGVGQREVGEHVLRHHRALFSGASGTANNHLPRRIAVDRDTTAMRRPQSVILGRKAKIGMHEVPRRNRASVTKARCGPGRGCSHGRSGVLPCTALRSTRATVAGRQALMESANSSYLFTQLSQCGLRPEVPLGQRARLCAKPCKVPTGCDQQPVPAQMWPVWA